tara:strand:+ start:6421 stop:6600 length:180 start_codon:yes stop_codon:yes gene_type:complete
MVKAFLSREDIPYMEKNVTEDPTALKVLIDMGHRTTPVTLIGGYKIVGYKPTELKAAIA